MTKHCIFDIGNVLINFSFAEFSRMLAEKTGIDRSVIDRLLSLESIIEPETGRVSGIDFFNSKFLPLLPDWTYDRWIEAWQDNYTLNDPGMALLRDLRDAGSRVYILSNLAEYNKAAIDRKFPDFFGMTHGNFYSYELGLHKPDIKIYLKTAELIGAVPADCTFFDDMPENAEGATRAGMRGITFSNSRIEEIRQESVY